MQAEWDKYFPLDENSGDLNIPNFDYTDFNGGFGGQGMDIASLMGGAAPVGAGAGMGMPPPPTTTTAPTAMDLPTAQELADMQFTPSFYARYSTDAAGQNLQW